MRASKPTGKTRASNPLRNLRELLGTGGKRLSTYKLSELVGIPSPTLRSIEIGRNAFSEGIQQRLRWRGLNWDQTTKRWVFTYNPELPLTIDLITSFNRLSRGSDLFQDLDARALCIKLITLLHTVPVLSYSALVLNLQDVLNRLRVEYKAVGEEKVFAETTPKFCLVETPSGAQTLVKEYTGKNLPEPDQLLNFSNLRKWHVRPEEETQSDNLRIVQDSAA
jgi:hypothetical protein